MTEQEFLTIKEKSTTFHYSSMNYLGYDFIMDYKILIDNSKVILIYGYNIESQRNEYHWASNHSEDLLSALNPNATNVLITFIPPDWVTPMKEAGYDNFAAWNDYHLKNLDSISESLNKLDEIKDSSQSNNKVLTTDLFLTLEECEAASDVTYSCKGQSRGFTGQTPEWMKQWITGTEASALETGTKNNAVLIHRNEAHEIVGILCTATYAHESEKGAVVWIREVAVNPKYQRQGIARKLILQALHYGKLHGAKRSFLAADECNEHAIHLYESLGFQSNKEDVQIDMVK